MSNYNNSNITSTDMSTRTITRTITTAVTTTSTIIDNDNSGKSEFIDANT